MQSCLCTQPVPSTTTGLAAFRRAALRPITQNAVGDHICHFVIDRLLFALQPSHRAVKEPFNMQHSAQSMDQQRHLVSRGAPRPGGIHQSETTVLWTQKVSPPPRLYTTGLYRAFNLNKAELRKMFPTTSVTPFSLICFTADLNRLIC